MEPLLTIAFNAAKNARKVIVKALENLDKIKIDRKGANDFVTEIDHKAEQIIIDTIRKAYPDHAFLAEESGEQNKGDFVWIIDPIDGTSNFIHGNPHFAISIAIKHKGKLLHGLTYDPLRHELFTASRGRGAYLNDKRLRVNTLKTLDDALIACCYAPNKQDLTSLYIENQRKILPHTTALRRSGAATLDFAYIAAGRLDGILTFNLNIWDIAAGILLVREAGGIVTDFQGSEKDVEKGNIIAGNPKIVKAILQVMNS